MRKGKLKGRFFWFYLFLKGKLKGKLNGLKINNLLY